MATKKGNPMLAAIMKTAGNQYASIADDGIVAGDVAEFIDTGSFILNALMSGSIHGGAPSNRITGFSAESSTGKCARGTEKIKVYFKTAEERDAFLRTAKMPVRGLAINTTIGVEAGSCTTSATCEEC